MELRSAILVTVVCQDSKVLPCAITSAIDHFRVREISAMITLDPFLQCSTFLKCSDVLVVRDLPVSPM